MWEKWYSFCWNYRRCKIFSYLQLKILKHMKLRKDKENLLSQKVNLNKLIETIEAQIVTKQKELEAK